MDAGGLGFRLTEDDESACGPGAGAGTGTGAGTGVASGRMLDGFSDSFALGGVKGAIGSQGTGEVGEQGADFLGFDWIVWNFFDGLWSGEFFGLGDWSSSGGISVLDSFEMFDILEVEAPLVYSWLIGGNFNSVSVIFFNLSCKLCLEIVFLYFSCISISFLNFLILNIDSFSVSLLTNSKFP